MAKRRFFVAVVGTNVVELAAAPAAAWGGDTESGLVGISPGGGRRKLGPFLPGERMCRRWEAMCALESGGVYSRVFFLTPGVLKGAKKQSNDSLRVSPGGPETKFCLSINA